MDIRAMPSSHPKEIAAVIALHRATMILDGVWRPCEKLALDAFLRLGTTSQDRYCVMHGTSRPDAVY